MNFVIKHKYRLLIYGITTFVVVVLFFVMTRTENSVAENLLAASVQVLFTVSLIDFLLARDRHQKYKYINKLPNEYIQNSIWFALSRISEAVAPSFDEFSTLDNYRASPDEIKERIERLYEYKEFSDYFEQTKDLSRENIERIKALEEAVSKSSNDIRDSIKKVEPHVDPDISDRFISGHSEKVAIIIARLKVHEEFITIHEKYGDELEKELGIVSQDLLNTDEIGGMSFEESVRSIIQDYLDLYVLAAEGKIHISP